MSQTLVLKRGSFLRKYATATKFSDGSHGDPDYFYTWRGAMASAGYSSVAQNVYVWNSLHGNWYRVFTIAK